MKTKENSSREIVPGHNAIWIRLILLSEYTEYKNKIETKINSKNYELFEKEIKKTVFKCNNQMQRR